MTNANSDASNSSPSPDPKEMNSLPISSSPPAAAALQASQTPTAAAASPVQRPESSAAAALQASQTPTAAAASPVQRPESSAAAGPSQPSDVTASTPAALREDLLKSAVSFLSSPNVRSSETAKKVAFLRQKGLTQPEIEEAFKRVGESGVNAAAQISAQTSASTPAALHRPAVPPRPAAPAAYTQIVYYPMPPPPAMPLQRIVGLALLVGFGTVGLTAAVLNIIKRFIGPIFDSIATYQLTRYTDRKNGFKTLEEKLKKEDKKDELDDVLDEEENTLVKFTEKHQVLSETLSRLVTLVDDRVKSLQNREPYGSLRDGLSGLKDAITQHSDSIYSSYSPYSLGRNNNQESPVIQGFKSEIRSFKGMLLNRRNFPMVNTSRPTTPIKQDTPSTPQ